MKDLEQGKRVPKYLRTHPPASDRQKRLEEYAAELAQRKRPAPALRPPETSADSVALTGTLPAVPIATNPWFPLTVGTTWVYEARLTGAPPSTFVVRIASRLRTPTGDVFRAETGLGSDAVVPFQYLATAESLWRRNRPSVAESPWQVEFVTAVPEGQPQTHGDSEFSRLPPETVSLPCGVFTDTLHLRKRAAGKSYELWFGRGIGLLKRTCVETGVTETLIRYTIAPPG